MSVAIILTGLLLVGALFVYLKKKRQANAPVVPVPATGTGPVSLTPQERVLELIGKINTASETYEIKQRRQMMTSRVVKRVMEISYIPIDDIQVMHDIDLIITSVRTKKACLEAVIFEGVNTMIFGAPTNDEIEILELNAALAYLKMKGRALILGFTYQGLCDDTPPPSVPQGYRETVAAEL